MTATTAENDGHADEQRERRRRRNQVVELERREDHEIEHADPATLERKRVAGAPFAQAPAESEQRDRADRNAGQPQLDRRVHVLIGVAEKKRDAEEEARRRRRGRPCSRPVSQRQTAESSSPFASWC